MRNFWKKIHCAVGAIDGTSHEINRPSSEQEQYYSGNRHYHAVHSQIVVDNEDVVRYVECGFLGHLNNAQQFRLKKQIGLDLNFPEECVLLGDIIYPNRHSVMTLHSAAQIRRKRGSNKRQCRKLNAYIKQHRVCIEHSIAELKCYRSVRTIWRHRRTILPRVVTICAGLVCRRKEIGLIM